MFNDLHIMIESNRAKVKYYTKNFLGGGGGGEGFCFLWENHRVVFFFPTDKNVQFIY